jgi:type II secretory pathway component GspD/PulD (secretin)
VKDITTANTTVSVQSGQTIVLGGMINTTNQVVDRKVPFLGDIPLLGRLFRYDLDRTDKKELLVFLTPVVLHSQEQADCLMREELSHSDVACIVAEQLSRWENSRLMCQPCESSTIDGASCSPELGMIHDALPPSVSSKADESDSPPRR